jgi:hypothetical protein
MKVLAAILILAALMFYILYGRPQKVNPRPYRPLEIGETNPPLKRIGSIWPLPVGTKIWLKTNQHPCGIITRCTEDQFFYVDPLDGPGGRESEFMRRPGLANYYTDADLAK